MELFRTSQIACNTIIKQNQNCVADNDENTNFQSYIDEMQIRSDIIEHLKGVPLDTVTIPSNIIEKMKTDKDAYTYYMNAIDEYVRGYKKYNCSGVIEMSFFITEDGRYAIRGENLILQQQIEESKNDDTHQVRENKVVQELLPSQQLSQTNQAEILTANLTAAYFMEHLRIFKRNEFNSSI